MYKVIGISNHQISVNEVGTLQVDHPLAHIQAHAQQSLPGEAASLAAQEVRQAAGLHVLKHQAHGGLLGAHSIQLDQLGVRQLTVQRKRVKQSLYHDIQKSTDSRPNLFTPVAYFEKCTKRQYKYSKE